MRFPHIPSARAGFLALATSAAALTGTALHAADAPRCEARSGPRVPHVVELYTSEGCSSCPPADQWFSRLKGRPDVIALAFHVDYWDRLGWKDRFAQRAFTERQEAVRRMTGGRFIYTPQVVLEGRDWRAWSESHLPAQARASTVAVHLARSGTRVEARITPGAGAPPRLAGYWAAVEDGHASAVQAGENQGATLHHDGVVRSYAPIAAWRADRPAVHAFESPPAGEGGRMRRAVLVLTDAETGRPVQALALACGG